MNKIVVISGGSQGLGRAIVDLYEKNGDTAVCLSRSKTDGIKNYIHCDVLSEGSVRGAAEEIKLKYGRVDILINNAGVGISGATELLPTDKIREVFDTDYYGALYLTRELLPLMEEKSKIVNISSACALFALPYRGVYCAAKAAMNMLSLSMRMELAYSKIKVVCVCPGDVRTTFTANRLKFYETNARYGNRIREAAEKIDTRQEKRMNPNKVAKKIFVIAQKKNKALYIIGFKYKFLAFMQKLLPTNLFISLTAKFFG